MRKQLEGAAAQLETLAATVRHQSSPVAVAAAVAAGFDAIAATLRAGLARADEVAADFAAGLAMLPPELRAELAAVGLVEAEATPAPEVQA